MRPCGLLDGSRSLSAFGRLSGIFGSLNQSPNYGYRRLHLVGDRAPYSRRRIYRYHRSARETLVCIEIQFPNDPSRQRAAFKQLELSLIVIVGPTVAEALGFSDAGY